MTDKEKENIEHKENKPSLKAHKVLVSEEEVKARSKVDEAKAEEDIAKSEEEKAKAQRDSLLQVIQQAAILSPRLSASTARLTPVPEGIQPLLEVNNFIKEAIPLWGTLCGTSVAGWLLGRFRFSCLWMPVVMWSIWHVLQRQVDRYQMYHTNRIEREIAKGHLDEHVETCEWINHIVDRFWTVVEPFISSQVIDQANKEMAKQCPPFLQSLELSEFTLGSSAPHVIGARVYPQTASDVIHLDLDVCFVPNEIINRNSFVPQPAGREQWNSRVVLTAGMNMLVGTVKAPVLVEEIVFYGKLRLQLYLGTNLPFVQTAEVSVREMPKINFGLRPFKGFDLLNIGLLKSFLNGFINKPIKELLLAPNKVTIDVADLVRAKKKTRMNSVGVLRVKVLQVRGIPKLSDEASVKVSVAGRLKAETGGMVNSSWNEVHYLLISSLSYPVTFSLFGDSGLLSSGEMLGTCKVSVDEVAGGENREAFSNVWRGLQRCRHPGELNVGVEYFPAEYMESEDPDPKVKTEAQPPQFKSGILQVTLHGAKELPPHPQLKDWSTFVEASVSNSLADDAFKRQVPDDLNPYVFKSKVKSKNNTPNWEETVEFLVVDYERDEVVLKLRDAKEDHPLGKLTMRAGELLDVSDWFTLKGAVSGKLYLSTLFKPIDVRIDDPSALKFAPAVGAVTIAVKDGKDFKKRLEIAGKEEYYVGALLNGRLVQRTRTVRTMENPDWTGEVLTIFLKAPSDKLVLKLFEESTLRKDSSEGAVEVSLASLFAQPGTTLSVCDQLRNEKGAPEQERLALDIAYYPVGEVKKEMPIDKTMLENGAIADVPSNAGILEVQNVCLWGFSEKATGKMKVSCAVTLSNNPLAGTTTKAVKAHGIKFTWEAMTELFVAGYKKTSLWLVFKDESGTLSEDTVLASISIPISVLMSGKEYIVPGMPAVKVSIIGGYRATPAVLHAPVDISGTLKIGIKKASVMGVDSGGTSDPYVTVKLNNKTVHKTKVIKKTVEPVWNEECAVKIPDRRTARLLFEVSDWNQVMMAEPLGKSEISLQSVVADRETVMEYTLQGVKSGSLTVSLLFETLAGVSAAGRIVTVPAVSEKESASIVGAPINLAADMTKGAAGAAGAVVGGGVSAVTGAAGALKSGVTGVFGLGHKTDDKPAKESADLPDLRFTIKAMHAAPEISHPYDSAIQVFLDSNTKIYKTKQVKKDLAPSWNESFNLSPKQIKQHRFLAFIPETTVPDDALNIAQGDKPVFRLDLSRPELAAEDGNTFVLHLNEREDLPPLTLEVEVKPVVVEKRKSSIGKAFGKLKFGL